MAVQGVSVFHYESLPSRCLPATPLPVKTNLENPDEIRTCGKDNFVTNNWTTLGTISPK